MTRTISSARLRLICHEIAAKVNARRGREEPTETAVLLELLRRVESHLGKKPAVLSSSDASRAQYITDMLAALVEVGSASAFPSILQEELLSKVTASDREGAKKSSRQRGLSSGV